MRNKFYIIFFLLSFYLSFSQNVGTSNGLVYYNDNFSTLVGKRTYSLSVGQQYNSIASQSHPDFGTLPYNAPQKNVVEVLEKRTVDERYYIDINDPMFFYIQKSGVPINFLKNGYLIAIDPTLEEVASGVYEAPNQPHPTKLDFNSKKTVLNCSGHFVENNRYTLTVLNSSNIATTYTANWGNHVVGNNGSYIVDAFPGIDMKLFFEESKVKANFIIKSPIANCKKLIFTDQLNLSPGLTLVQQSGFPGQLFVDEISILDASNTQQFLIKKANSYDASGSRAHSTFNSYKIIGNDVELHVDSVFLNMPGVVYPITVDPLFTAVGPIAAPANAIGSLLSPGFCSQNLTIVYPGGSTPWDFSTTWQTASGACCTTGPPGPAVTCFNSDPRIEILSNCGGRTPSGAGLFWSCNPGCNTPGTWGPTLPFNSSGCQSMVQCLTPSCSNQNITFTFNLLRVFCSNNLGCNCTYATNTCVRLNSWGVTLQGRSAETLANTVTGNGTTSQAATCFSSVTMNPNAQFGVSPFTYVWAPGGQTTPTRTFMPTAPGSNVFTCTVTDACGTIRVATFTITNNCVLPIQLTEYTAQYDGNAVNLNWTTASEKNSNYFTIEKSLNGIDYVLVEKVNAAGSSSSTKKYTVKDNKPNKNGPTYYRLKQFDTDGSEQYNKVITIDIQEESVDVKLIPNPASTDLDVVLSEKFIGKTVNIELFDTNGKKSVLKQNIKVESGNKTIHLNITDIPQGTYFINVITEDFSTYKNKLVKY